MWPFTLLRVRRRIRAYITMYGRSGSNFSFSATKWIAAVPYAGDELSVEKDHSGVVYQGKVRAITHHSEKDPHDVHIFCDSI